MGLNCHVDDLFMATSDEDETKLVRRLRNAAVDLAELVEEEFECNVALPKASLIASSFKLQRNEQISSKTCHTVIGQKSQTQ